MPSINGMIFGVISMQTLLLFLSTTQAATIGGHVLGPDGDVVGATVVVYDQRFGYATALTDAAGDWTISGIPSNVYRVRVLPDYSQNLTERWSGETREVCVSPVYVVSESDTPNVVVQLVAGGEIVGEVFDQFGMPVNDVVVTALSLDPNSAAESRLSMTDKDGYFELSGLPTDLGESGDFLVEMSASGWPDQYIPGVYEEEIAVIVSLTGAERQTVDQTSLQPGITVRGEVSTPDGLLEDGTAYVYSASTVISTSVMDGQYEVEGLPPGDVLTWVSADLFGTTYYPDADRPTTMVPADEGAVAELDISMPFESRMVGYFAGTGDLSGVSLLAYNDTKTVGVGVLSDEDGGFIIDGLHGGDYTIYVYGSSAGAVSGFVTDDSGEPFQYTVADEDDLLDLTLVRPEAAVASGTIVDADTGMPVYGAVVYGTHAEGESFGVSTGMDGFYEATGLLPGEWHLEARYDAYCDEDADWTAVHYPEARYADAGAVLVLTATETVTWDVSLSTDSDHDDMADGWEQEYGLVVGFDDGSLDPDLDGLTNLEEYWLDTDPNTFDNAVSSGTCGCATRYFPVTAWVPFLSVIYLRRRRASLLSR
jgi:hypothetical protein